MLVRYPQSYPAAKFGVLVRIGRGALLIAAPLQAAFPTKLGPNGSKPAAPGALAQAQSRNPNPANGVSGCSRPKAVNQVAEIMISEPAPRRLAVAGATGYIVSQ